MTYCKGICNRFEKSSKRDWWKYGKGMRCKSCGYYFKKKTSDGRCPCCGSICKVRPLVSNATREFHEQFIFRY